MKKLFYVISTVALMASFASCNKIEQENTPVGTPSEDGTTTLTVSATVPQTKTNLNNGKVRWSSGDVISILAEGYDLVRSSEVDVAAERFNFTVENWYAGVTPEYAAFTGPFTDEENFNRYAPKWNDDGTIQMTVRSAQPIYNQDSFSKLSNISLGELVETDGVYTTEMKNVCGLLKFTLTKPTKSVVIEDTNGGLMCGKVNVTMVDGNPKATLVDGSGVVTVTSKIGKTDATLAHDDTYSYFATVIPGTYTPKITITPVEGEVIVLIAKQSITVNRNEYIDLGTLDAVAEEGGDEPVIPDQQPIVITLDFSESWPFNEHLETNKKITEKTTYTLTQNETTYSFDVFSETGSSGGGFYFNGSALRLTNQTSKNTGQKGYLSIPAISDYKLTSLDATITNTSNIKNLLLYAGCTVSDNIITVSEKIGDTMEINASKTTNGHFDITGTSANTTYYLYTESANYQLGKLVLTYTK